MAFMMICSKPPGILGFRVDGMGAPPLMCWMATATGDSPSYGGRPVIISYMTTPREYRSDRLSTRLPLACSGEM